MLSKVSWNSVHLQSRLAALLNDRLKTKLTKIRVMKLKMVQEKTKMRV